MRIHVVCSWECLAWRCRSHAGGRGPVRRRRGAYAVAGGQPQPQPAAPHHHQGSVWPASLRRVPTRLRQGPRWRGCSGSPADRGRRDDATAGDGRPGGRTGARVRLPGQCGRDGTGDDGGRSCSRLRGGRWPGHDGERQCSGLRGRGRGRRRAAIPAPIGVSRSGQAPYGDPRMAAMGATSGRWRTLRSLGRPDVHTSGSGRACWTRSTNSPTDHRPRAGSPKFGHRRRADARTKNARSTPRSPTTNPAPR